MCRTFYCHKHLAMFILAFLQINEHSMAIASSCCGDVFFPARTQMLIDADDEDG